MLDVLVDGSALRTDGKEPRALRCLQVPRSFRGVRESTEAPEVVTMHDSLLSQRFEQRGIAEETNVHANLILIYRAERE
jgi:hypothetical protein